MALASYSELVSELGDFLNRTDLSAKIPTFIRLFETRANRLLRAPDMEQSFTFTTVSGTDTYAINSRVRELRELYLTSSDLNIEFDYTVTGESIVFDPAPEGEYEVTYKAYATLPGLSSGQTSNWLLDDHPDVYLYGTLAEAFAYERDEEQAAKYKALSEEALSEIIREANEKRLPAGPLKMQPPVIE